MDSKLVLFYLNLLQNEDEWELVFNQELAHRKYLLLLLLVFVDFSKCSYNRGQVETIETAGYIASAERDVKVTLSGLRVSRLAVPEIRSHGTISPCRGRQASHCFVGSHPCFIASFFTGNIWHPYLSHVEITKSIRVTVTQWLVSDMLCL